MHAADIVQGHQHADPQPKQNVCQSALHLCSSLLQQPSVSKQPGHGLPHVIHVGWQLLRYDAS